MGLELPNSGTRRRADKATFDSHATFRRAPRQWQRAACRRKCQLACCGFGLHGQPALPLGLPGCRYGKQLASLYRCCPRAIEVLQDCLKTWRNLRDGSISWGVTVVSFPLAYISRPSTRTRCRTRSKESLQSNPSSLCRTGRRTCSCISAGHATSGCSLYNRRIPWRPASIPLGWGWCSWPDVLGVPSSTCSSLFLPGK